MPAHLQEFEDVLRDLRQPLKVACGKTLPRPKLEIIWNVARFGMPELSRDENAEEVNVNSLMVCAKCLKSIETQSSNKALRYLYVLSNRKEESEGVGEEREFEE